MTQTEKDTIYWMVHRCVEADGGREKIMTGRACLNWMIHGAVILHKSGIETIPQAGSASFRFLPEHLWRREGDPHPGCCYQPYPQAIQFILNFMRQKAYANATHA